MEKRRRVVLLGSSLIVATLGASLRRSESFDVYTFSQGLQESEELKALVPDVIVFDLEAPRPEVAFLLLEKLPGLMLIGVSPDNNLVKMWSGKQLRELSTKELVGVIEEQLNCEGVLEEKTKP